MNHRSYKATASYNTPMVYTLTIKANTTVIKNAESALIEYADELKKKNGKSEIYVYEDRVVIENEEYKHLITTGYSIRNMLELAQEGEIVLFKDGYGFHQLALA